MKNVFFAAGVALALFASCSKQDNEIKELHKGAKVNISFTDESPNTRAFFGTTAAAETWEKELRSMSLYVFDGSGNLIVQRIFSGDELTAKRASFALPDVTPGSSCEFYAVANLSGNVANKSALLALLETSSVVYNGTFAQVTEGIVRPYGFVMSGSATKPVAAVGATTDVAIALKRTVAKVAIETSISGSFSSMYPGAIRVNSVSIRKSASQSPVIKPATPNPGAMNFAVTQLSNVSSGKYQNLFYLFENGDLAPGSRVLAEVYATYDKDGNFSTTGDQSAMEYNMELIGNSAGALSRNGYYRVAVTINGLSGSDAVISITAADWEIPVTQTINVGM